MKPAVDRRFVRLIAKSDGNFKGYLTMVHFAYGNRPVEEHLKLFRGKSVWERVKSRLVGLLSA